MSIVDRLEKFVMGTTRGRKQVKCIRPKKEHYEEYKTILVNLSRYDVDLWEAVEGHLYFHAIPVWKHLWL